MTRERWTDEQISTLRRLYSTEPLRSIAVLVGKPLGSVSTKAMRLGLSHKKPRWTSKETATLREMVEASRSDPEIAKVIGKPVVAVQRKRQCMGLVRWRQQPRHDEAAKLAALLEDVILLLRAKAPHHEILETIYEGRAGAETL